MARAPFVGPQRQSQFEMQIGAWANKAKGRADLIARKAVIELVKSVVLKSPVDTGRFRANWQVSYGKPNVTTSEDTDRSGGVAIARGTSLGLSFPMGQTFWIANGLPYALPLEYGHSQQAPQGMVRLSKAEFEAQVAKIATAAARGD